MADLKRACARAWDAYDAVIRGGGGYLAAIAAYNATIHDHIMRAIDQVDPEDTMAMGERRDGHTRVALGDGTLAEVEVRHTPKEIRKATGHGTTTVTITVLRPLAEGEDQAAVEVIGMPWAATATCTPPDTFNRGVGRYLALRRVMMQDDAQGKRLPRPARAAIWKLVVPRITPAMTKAWREHRLPRALGVPSHAWR